MFFAGIGLAMAFGLAMGILVGLAIGIALWRRPTPGPPASIEIVEIEDWRPWWFRALALVKPARRDHGR